MRERDVEEKESRVERDYNYNYITITRNPREFSKGKRWPILHIYVKRDNQYIHDKLKKILAREGSSTTAWFWNQVETYVRLHEPGNPQQQLDLILERGKPYRAEGCVECGKKSFVLACKQGKSVQLCKVHFEKFRRRLDGWREL